MWISWARQGWRILPTGEGVSLRFSPNVFKWNGEPIVAASPQKSKKIPKSTYLLTPSAIQVKRAVRRMQKCDNSLVALYSSEQQSRLFHKVLVINNLRPIIRLVRNRRCPKMSTNVPPGKRSFGPRWLEKSVTIRSLRCTVVNRKVDYFTKCC